MNFSLNEVDAMAKKAARGAGYPWGLAEEAGKAARWLCAHGLDGCGALARLLNRTDGVDLAAWTPIEGEGGWTAPGGTICPLIAGTVLADGCHDLREGPVNLENVAEPLLVLPFVSMASDALGAIVTAHAGHDDGSIQDGALCLAGDFARDAAVLTIEIGGAIDHQTQSETRARPTVRDWAKLAELAHRTYAPASEASRLSGAGAGLSDND